MKLADFIHGFDHLFFPRTCQACGHVLYKQEKVLCTKCLYHLPKTNFWHHADNPVAEIFWGRVELNAAASFLFFNKSGKVQHLMHNLKYRGKKQIGPFMGELIGKELKKSKQYQTVDMVLPVPLHPDKLTKRGYNQSALIAKGIAQSMKIPVYTDLLIKTKNTESQTKKSRYERWQNVSRVFKLQNPSLIKNKHILLVDDVITTGATIEACAQVLLHEENVTVSVFSLAYAQG